MEQLADYKDQARATWAEGDYDAMMRQERLYGVGQRLVDRMGVTPGQAVLDVACGTGNAAIPAARAGGRVTGVDLSPQMLRVARGRAADAGVEVDWQEADAEQLPFDDGQFEVVLSTFGCMFAPRHEVAADELARVLRPGGRLGVCSWTPEGVFGEFFRVVAAHLPADPEFAQPPLLWGDPAHVREVFEGTGLALEFERERWRIEHDSPDAATTCYTTTLGPVVAARRLADENGHGDRLRDELTGLFARSADGRTGHVSFDAEYLLVLGHRPGGT